MYRYEFTEDDLFINRLKTYPEYELFIYQSRLYINREQPPTASTTYPAGPNGCQGRQRDGLQVFDINQNRLCDDLLVQPFINTNARKDDWRFRFYNPLVKTISGAKYDVGANIKRNSFSPYTIGTTSYHNTAYSGSITVTRTLTTAVSSVDRTIFDRSSGLPKVRTVTYKRPTNLTASVLVNVAQKYSHLSKHFNLLGQDQKKWGRPLSTDNNVIPARNLTTSDVNMIFIPQMYYGSTIKKGSVYLNYFYTGSMLAACHDKNHNGELIGTTGSTAGVVVGIVLYDEGIIMLTSSRGLERSDASGAPALKYSGPSGADIASSWLYYGTTLNDGIAIGSNVNNASYELKFKGTSYLNSMTMFAKAPRGQLNHSNNPTWQNVSETTASITGKGKTFSEGTRLIKNVVSASYASASFEKTTYISKVRLYDENNNLIGIASLANPVKKTMDRDYTFKLKLDI